MPGPGKTIRRTAVVLSPLCWQRWKWVTCTQTIWHKRQKPCLQQQLLFFHSSNSFHQTSDAPVMVSILVDKVECEKDAFAQAAANHMKRIEHLMKISCSYCNSCDKGKRMSLVETRCATSVSSIWSTIMHEEPKKIQTFYGASGINL